MINHVKKIISLVLSMIIFVGVLSGCGEKALKSTNSDMTFSTKAREYSVSFLSSENSERIKISKNQAQQLEQYISTFKPEYPYTEFFGVEECYDRIFTDSSVKKHKYSALDKNGKLTAEHLRDLVKENNAKFLEGNLSKNFYKEPDDEFLLSLCQLIVDVINEVKTRNPDVDYDRVYCNLARLTVFYKTGCLNFADVTPEMMMELGDSMLQFATILAGGTAVRDVVVHETMHIIQLGCTCEKIEHCDRRVGITYLWDDVEFQGNDWSWFFEGSAEKNMSLLTGDDTMTYQHMVNYLQSLNLATFLESDIPANYVETISFYNDPYKLFDVFGAETKEEITEIANLLEAIEIIQQMPDEFKEAYKNKYNIDLSTDEEESKVRIALKPAVCLTLTKAFYKNLADSLSSEEGITENDFYYLLRIFEAAMAYHSSYEEADRLETNKPFLDGYKNIRTKLFSMLAENGYDVSFERYLSYEMFTEKENVANASFLWLPDDKKGFLLERTEYLTEELKNKIS